MPEIPTQRTTFEFLTKVAGQLALWYSILFVYGWVYVVSFYDEFNIDVSMLDIPVHHFVTESLFGFQGIIALNVTLVVPVFLLRMLYIAV